jgi:hypothetical protein
MKAKGRQHVAILRAGKPPPWLTHESPEVQRMATSSRYLVQSQAIGTDDDTKAVDSRPLPASVSFKITSKQSSAAAIMKFEAPAAAAASTESASSAESVTSQSPLPPHGELKAGDDDTPRPLSPPLVEGSPTLTSPSMREKSSKRSRPADDTAGAGKALEPSLLCFLCGRHGHYATLCSARDRGHERERFIGRCYLCGSDAHAADHCIEDVHCEICDGDDEKPHDTLSCPSEGGCAMEIAINARLSSYGYKIVSRLGPLATREHFTQLYPALAAAPGLTTALPSADVLGVHWCALCASPLDPAAADHACCGLSELEKTSCARCGVRGHALCDGSAIDTFAQNLTDRLPPGVFMSCGDAMPAHISKTIEYMRTAPDAPSRGLCFNCGSPAHEGWSCDE